MGADGISARRRWGLVAMFAAIAIPPPILLAATEAALVGRAFTVFFGILAVLAAVSPDIFLAPRY